MHLFFIQLCFGMLLACSYIATSNVITKNSPNLQCTIDAQCEIRKKKYLIIDYD
jgi:hypothetical protein